MGIYVPDHPPVKNSTELTAEEEYAIALYQLRLEDKCTAEEIDEMATFLGVRDQLYRYMLNMIGVETGKFINVTIKES